MFVAIGCRAQPTGDQHVTPEPTPTEVAPARERPAFLVQTKRATLVVPIDPSVPLVRVDGIWTALGRDAYGRVETVIRVSKDPAVAPLGICADASDDTGCRMSAEHGEVPVTMSIEATSGAAPTWRLTDSRDRECTCVVVEGISTDEEEPDPDLVAEAEALGMTPEEYAEVCLQEEIPDLVPTSMLGGVLYLTGMGHSGTCNGLNIYDGADDAISLRPGAKPIERAMPEIRECVDTFAELSLDWLGVAEPECRLGDPECNCRGEVEMEAWALRRGNLVRAIGEIEAVGSGCSCAVQVPITAATCPSPSDPCGDLAGFTTIETTSDHFWIANEGLAFVLRQDRLMVVQRGDSKPIRDEPIPTPGIDFIGVEYVRDAALIDPPEFPRSFRVGRAALADADAKFGGSASEWGDRCVVHLRAKRWDDAEAACFAGLEEGGSNKTRGALTYNLGRVAEGRGDAATALRWYRRSDRLRPGNATVKARIDALAKP